MSDTPAVRGMSFGEIVSETLRNYGKSFFPIFAVALVLQILASLVMIPVTTEQEKIQAELLKDPTVLPQFDPTLFGLKIIVTFVIILTLTVLTQAALTVYYVGRLLKKNMNLSAVFGRVLPIAGKLFGLSAIVSLLASAGPILGIAIAAVMGNLGAGLLLMIAGVVLAIMIGIRFSLSGAAMVLEGIGIRQALARAQILSQAYRGRIFLLGLIYFASIFVVSLFIGTFALASGNALFFNIVATLVSALIYPFLLCGLVQVYLSSRAEKEGLTDASLEASFFGEAGTASTSPEN